MRRRTSLVCQFLENVSRTGLDQYQSIIRHYVRKRQGIYALYRKDKLYYVGLASNLAGRLKAHLRNRHGASWDRFSLYLTIGDEHMKELESLLLRITRPKGNKVSGKFPRAENLKRRLVSDAKKWQREELDELLGFHRPVAKKQRIADMEDQPVLAGYVNGQRLALRCRWKGQLFKAVVRRDGRIRFKGKLYKSPSAAGTAVRLGKATNGWSFWLYERAPGDWVPLSTMRT